jgi:serine/threonine-protein kinase
LQKLDTLLEGKYEILDRLREGGMGTIYRVRHRLLDEVRVIKVMRPHAVADKDLKRRFFEEARTATRLKHPNICQILDFALDDEGTAYLVMEFIDGVNLSELLGVKGPPGMALALEVAHQTLLALGYLHRKNVVHRDIAPDNIMVSRSEDGRPLIKLVDLGIAKVADAPTEMTQTGVFLGKLRYASPEQFGALDAGQRLDGRSDLYSLGVVLFELTTGVRPFSGESPPELLRAHLFAPPMPFSEADPMQRVPPELRATILKALEKKRENRWANAEEFDREIQALQRRSHRDEDLDATIAFLSSLPKIQPPERPPTGSAQSRLDRQFGPLTTPPPSPESGAALTLLPTAIAPGTPIAEPPETPVTAGTKRFPTATTEDQISAIRGQRRPRTPLVIAAAAGAVGIAAILVLRSPWRGGTARETAGLPAVPPASTPAASREDSSGTRSEAPRPSPGSPSPIAVAAVPAAEPTAAPAQDAVAPPPPAESAPEPTREPARPTPRPTRAPRPTAAPPARAAVPAPVPTAPLIVAESRPAPVQLEPTRPAPAVPAPASGAVAAPPAAPTSGVPAKAAATENDRIREAVHRYERAQSTLDADLYKRVFPTVDQDRIAHAFASLSSQSVELEVRRIQISPDGSRADVFGFERRTAVPRAGSEQRIQADRVLHMEKQGDAWVITRLE